MLVAERRRLKPVCLPWFHHQGVAVLGARVELAWAAKPAGLSSQCVYRVFHHPSVVAGVGLEPTASGV